MHQWEMSINQQFSEGSAELKENVLSMEAKVIRVVAPPPERSKAHMMAEFQTGTPL